MGVTAAVAEGVLDFLAVAWEASSVWARLREELVTSCSFFVFFELFFVEADLWRVVQEEVLSASWAREATPDAAD